MCIDQQIGRNVEAYIDDVVVKSKTTDNLIADLEETFANLKKVLMEVEPFKVHLWSSIWYTAGLHCQCSRHQT